MFKWLLLFVGTLLAMAVCSCIVPETRGYSDIPLTHSEEDFRRNYPRLSLSYYDNIRVVESLALKGKKLYDRYYRLKDERNQVDMETNRRAREVFDRALKAVWKIFQETRNSSLLSIRQKLSTWEQDLLREIEKSGGTPAPGLPK